MPYALNVEFIFLRRNLPAQKKSSFEFSHGTPNHDIDNNSRVFSFLKKKNVWWGGSAEVYIYSCEWDE